MNRIIFLWLISIGIICSSCKKEAVPPRVLTDAVTNILPNEATCGGQIVYDGNARISECGLCWSTHPYPSIEDDKMIVSSSKDHFTGNISSLIPFTTYFVRAYATNEQGTAYGDIVRFSTPKIPGEIVYDVDGNLYHSITIGTQVWLLENLKTTHFRNGDTIKNIQTDNIAWNVIQIPAYCSYENDDSLASIYGLLYNWYAVGDSRGLTPEGWHVPSVDEWQQLIDFCGGSIIGAGKLKKDGFEFWDSPNLGASNESGFSALASGYRDYNGEFSAFGSIGVFWTSTSLLNTTAFYNALECYSMQVVNGQTVKRKGFSIRAIKD